MTRIEDLDIKNDYHIDYSGLVPSRVPKRYSFTSNVLLEPPRNLLEIPYIIKFPQAFVEKSILNHPDRGCEEFISDSVNHNKKFMELYINYP
jgi:hypothetical protein